MANLDAKLNVIVMLAICFAGYYILTAPKEPIAPPDDAWFQAAVVNQPEPVLVKFGAEWCGPCRMLDPELSELGNSMRGLAQVVRIDIDKRSELARHYGVLDSADHGLLSRKNSGRLRGLCRPQPTARVGERRANSVTNCRRVTPASCIKSLRDRDQVRPH